MNKKASVVAILFFLVLPFSLLSVDQVRTIEFVARKFTERFPYRYAAVNPTISEPLNSGLVLTVHVPPLPKHDTIFFEVSARCTYKWSGFQLRKTNVSIKCQLINPAVIPEGIRVATGSPGIPWDQVENNALNKGAQNYDRAFRSFMRREGSWENGDIYVMQGGNNVPDEVARTIINALFDNGYDVEISVDGTIQGVELFELNWACLEITCLAKK